MTVQTASSMSEITKIKRRRAPLHFKVEIGQPVLCTLCEPSFFEREVYAMEVDVCFYLVIRKGSGIQKMEITIDHNGQTSLEINFLEHPNELAVRVRSRTTPNLRPASHPMEPPGEQAFRRRQ